MSRTTLKIEGMSCGHCIGSVRKALESLEGVTVENVSVGAATVAYDPAVASPEEFAEAIAEAGYTASLIA